MKLTPLLAAALLLVAAAPSASALCLGNTTCVGATVKVANEGTSDVTGTVIAVVGIVTALTDDLTVDEDQDNFPDAAEMAICGNGLLFAVVNTDAVPGHCVTQTDYFPPDFLEDIVTLVMLVLGIADEVVKDLLEDAGELGEDVEKIVMDTRAFAEQKVNEAYDAIDLDRDNVPDALEPLICERVQNDNFPQDGTCNTEHTDYDPPL